VYLQDTFSNAPLDRRLRYSHLLALTAERTGASQLGAYYDVAPYPTSRWTGTEQGRLFNSRVETPEHLDRLARQMRAANASHLVLADPELAQRVAAHPAFAVMHRVGRFTVLSSNSGPLLMAEPQAQGVAAAVLESTPGRILIGTRVDLAAPTPRLVVKESYHPFWTVRGAPDVVISQQRPSGFMELTGLPRGEGQVELVYEAPTFPLWISVMGLLGIAGLATRRSSRG
jgi:hypothetical protein